MQQNGGNENLTLRKKKRIKSVTEVEETRIVGLLASEGKRTYLQRVLRMEKKIEIRKEGDGNGERRYKKGKVAANLRLWSLTKTWKDRDQGKTLVLVGVIHSFIHMVEIFERIINKIVKVSN